MSTFANDCAADLTPDLLTELGEALTYTPASGAALALTGVFQETSGDELPATDGREQVRRAHVLISTDPASAFGGVASPALNATLTRGSEVWAVRGCQRLPGQRARLQVGLIETVEKGRGGYRRMVT